MPENERSLQETERIRVAVNSEVVRLLNEKIVPLNKARYMHLQKIGRAVAKGIPHGLAFSSQFSLNQGQKSLRSPPSLTKSTSSPLDSRNDMADLLLDRLKIIKSRQNIEEDISHHKLPNLRQAMQTQLPNLTSKLSIKTPKSQTRRKRQNLIDLALRAEKYLRAKKRELKERHNQEHYSFNEKITQLQRVQPLQSITFGRQSNKQLQMELLRDIREQMLQVKMNRMKRQINHKKIVQMR